MDPCEWCGGEGEIWFDVEMPDGRVLEDCRPCGVCEGTGEEP